MDLPRRTLLEKLLLALPAVLLASCGASKSSQNKDSAGENGVGVDTVDAEPPSLDPAALEALLAEAGSLPGLDELLAPLPDLWRQVPGIWVAAGFPAVAWAHYHVFTLCLAPIFDRLREGIAGLKGQTLKTQDQLDAWMQDSLSRLKSALDDAAPMLTAAFADAQEEIDAAGLDENEPYVGSEAYQTMKGTWEEAHTAFRSWIHAAVDPVVEASPPIASADRKVVVQGALHAYAAFGRYACSPLDQEILALGSMRGSQLKQTLGMDCEHVWDLIMLVAGFLASLISAYASAASGAVAAVLKNNLAYAIALTVLTIIVEAVLFWLLAIEIGLIVMYSKEC